MMTPPLIRSPRRQDAAAQQPAAAETAAQDAAAQATAAQAPKRRSRWDAFFTDPAAIESDYHRMVRRHEDRPAGGPPARRP